MIIAITVIAVIAGKSTAFEAGGVNFIKIPLLILGILLIVLGVYLWAWILSVLFGLPMAVALKIPNLPLTNAFATGWINIGNIWMFCGYFA